MSTKNIALGLLASKIDRGEVDSLSAVEQAYYLGRKEKNEDDGPITVRQGSAKKIFKPLVLEDF